MKRILLIALLALSMPAGAQKAPDIIPGIRLFSGITLGYYQNYLGNAMGLAFDFTVPVPLLTPGFLNTEFLYSRTGLVSSNASHLDSTAFGFSYLPAWSPGFNVDFYAGPGFRMHYAVLTADRRVTVERAMLPAAILKTGLFTSLSAGLGARMELEYEYTELSQVARHQINTSAGVTYNYAGHMRLVENRESRMELEKGTGNPPAASRVAELYSDGEHAYNKGDLDKAQFSFDEVLSLSPGHEGAKNYLSLISARKIYDTARSDIANKNYFSAIVSLEKASKVYTPAAYDLKQLRWKMSSMIPSLEKDATKAYESQNYKRSIDVFSRVRLIDPENETAALYIPRAQQRLKALSTLE